MKSKIMTSVIAGLLLACAGLANAAEPVALTDSQMDSVAAGATFAVAGATASALYGFAASAATTRSISFGLLDASSATAAGVAFGIGARTSAFAASAAY
jgi:hypothetical protein